MKLIKQHPSVSLILLLVTLFTLISLIYYPGITGGLMADDFPNIADNNGIQIEQLSLDNLSSAWSANSSGLLKRPISSLSFALNYYFSGQQINPAHFKLTNIGIHIINSFLVFFISRLLFAATSKHFPAQKLGFICALIWAVHPLQLTSVLYIVQRMNSLSFMFMLAGFLVFLKARLQFEKPGQLLLMLAGCLFGTLFAAFSKENGVLLPFLILVTEITLLRNVPIQNPRNRNKLYSFYTITAIIPALIAVSYLLTHSSFFLNGYNYRDFSFTERLATEARALFYYLGLLFYPDHSQLALYHDDYSVSRSLFNPVSTLPAILGVLGLLIIAAVCIIRKQLPYLSFAIAWFFVAHSMESSIFPLEIMFEHRNYVPSFGIIFGLVGLIYPLTRHINKPILVNLLYASIVLGLSLATFSRASIWSSSSSIAYFEMRNHPMSVRAQSTYAKSIELKNGPDSEIYQHYLKAAQLDLQEISPLTEMFIILNRIILDQASLTPASNFALPSSYTAPLVENKTYLLALSELLNKEILRRIKTKSNPLRTVISLRVVTNCLLNNFKDCRDAAPNLLAWTEAALQKPDFPDKGTISIIRAKTLFYQGKLEEAYKNVDLAIQYSPNEFYFYAEKAYFHIVTKEFDKAEQVLDDVAATHNLLGTDLREISKLKGLIQHKRAELAQSASQIKAPVS
ncbi:MAG: hypothetical protein WC782_13010 [Methylococcaceae bacterium]|jgi:hypothetical protein